VQAVLSIYGVGNGGQAMAYAPQADEPEMIAAPAVRLGHVQRRLLDAGRILVTGG
jgi:hypothetical protein